MRCFFQPSTTPSYTKSVHLLSIPIYVTSNSPHLFHIKPLIKSCLCVQPIHPPCLLIDHVTSYQLLIQLNSLWSKFNPLFAFLGPYIDGILTGDETVQEQREALVDLLTGVTVGTTSAPILPSHSLIFLFREIPLWKNW